MIWFLIPMITGAINSLLSLLGNDEFQKFVALAFLGLVITDVTGIYTFGEFQMEMLDTYNAVYGWFETQIIDWIKGVIGL